MEIIPALNPVEDRIFADNLYILIDVLGKGAIESQRLVIHPICYRMPFVHILVY